MDTSVEKPQFAWQPLTARGVAAFARASTGRLLVMQFVVAFLAAGAVIWFLRTAWSPVLGTAISRMPEQGEIRAGLLDWRGDSPQAVAENRFLALSVDLRHEGGARSPAHVQLEFGQADLRVLSLAGFMQVAYPAGWRVAFNREELGPWWGAWAPAITAAVAGVVIVGLIVLWGCLATVYCVLVWLLGFFANRDLSLRGSWRLAGAALLPGALFLIGAIVLYSAGLLDLVQLIAAAALHFVIPWGFLVGGALRSPRLPDLLVVQPNPFVPLCQQPAKPEAEKPTEGNPPPS